MICIVYAESFEHLFDMCVSFPQLHFSEPNLLFLMINGK